MIANDSRAVALIIDQNHRATQVFLMVLEGLFAQKPTDFFIAAVEKLSVVKSRNGLN